MSNLVRKILLCLSISVACGRTIFQPTGRIVGGTVVPIEKFPWIVSLWIKDYYLCGGFIYNERIIITAAHCTKTLLASYRPDHIVAGSKNLVSSESKGVLSVNIVDSLVHPLYDMETNEYDIEILLLEKPIKFSDSIKSVKIFDDKSDSITVGDVAYAAGWGMTNKRGKNSNDLLSVNVTVASQSYCERAYKELNGQKVTDNMICAGGVADEGVCYGDSGSPLVYKDQVIGITSWGTGCAENGYPGVYTRVSQIKYWIDQAAVKILRDYKKKACPDTGRLKRIYYA